MKPSDQPESAYTPRFPALLAGCVFVIAALTLLYPIFSGKFLGGSDQVHAGYAFRAFAAQGMQQTGHVPQWNPFIFGGMPLWAVPGHFDVFYPTAWLRWIMRADVALSVSFFIHFIVAGFAMYALLRTLKSSWTAAVTAGLAYELSGILASQVSPGHDGKLYAAALAPFAFVALIRAIRYGKTSGYGLFALIIGLVMLTPHYLAAYYLLVATAVFTLWLVFFDPERIRGRSPVLPLAFTALAVVLGLGIAAVELIPVQHMVAYTARGQGGESLGFDYASSWAMAPEEIMSTILPQFNGILDHYWGQNPLKDHTEYLGALVVVLAIFGIGAARKKGLLAPLAGIAILFLLVAWGGHSPFYHLWYLMPKMGQFRAPGLAFYLVALSGCVFAGLGTDRLLSGGVTQRMFLVTAGTLAVIALLAAAGLLQGVAESLAIPGRGQFVQANAPELQSGGIRLLVVMIVGGVLLFGIQRRALAGSLAAAALAVAVIGDNWSILREFPRWFPPAPVTFADDAFTTEMKKTPLPFRSFTPASPDNPDPQARAQIGSLGVYTASSLMARGVPTLLGYHGMEDRFFDALLGGKNVWTHQFSFNIWDLYAVKYIALSQDMPSLPGYHKIRGPLELGDIAQTVAPEGVLFERDSAPQWVRVVPAAVKVADTLVPPTVSDPRFPVNSYVLVPDTAQVKAEIPGAATPAPATVTAALKSWKPGQMAIQLAGSDTRTTWLVVAENWYPDWHAKVDGKDVVAHRVDGALLGVEIPPGAKDVTLDFDIASYHTGKWVSLLALLTTGLLLISGRLRPRPRMANG